MFKKYLVAIALLCPALARADIETPPLYLNLIHSDNQFQLYLSSSCEASRFHWPGQNDSFNDIVQTFYQEYSPMSFCVNMTGYTPAITVTPVSANCTSANNTISPGAYLTAIGQRASFVGCERYIAIYKDKPSIGFGGYAIRFNDALQQAYSYFDSGGNFSPRAVYTAMEAHGNTPLGMTGEPFSYETTYNYQYNVTIYMAPNIN